MPKKRTPLSGRVLDAIKDAKIERRARGTNDPIDPIFSFSRNLSGLREFRHEEPDAIVRRTVKILRSVGTDLSVEFPDREDPALDLVRNLVRVGTPNGENPLQLAVSRAKRRPVYLARTSCYSSKYWRTFISTLFHLQLAAPTRSLFLPQTLLAVQFGCSQRTISSLVAEAERRGYLQRTNRHVYFKGSPSSHKAAEYLFALQRFAENRSEIPPEASATREQGKQLSPVDQLDQLDQLNPVNSVRSHSNTTGAIPVTYRNQWDSQTAAVDTPIVMTGTANLRGGLANRLSNLTNRPSGAAKIPRAGRPKTAEEWDAAKREFDEQVASQLGRESTLTPPETVN
jgi:hypothetical protein